MKPPSPAPASLKFWWKVSSEAPWDFLRFRIDGAETPEARGISGERAWEQKIIFVPAGTHVLSWAYSKDGSTSKGDDAGWIDKVVYTRLAEGPDVPDRDWTTSGNNNWFSQTYTSRLPGGVDAAQSGDIDDNQSSRLETTVTGPAEVRFGWKVSSEKDFDFLRFRIDGAELPGMPGISGDFYPQNFGTGWKKEIALIPAGIHTLSWTYEKDGSVSSVADTGWVDNVLITPAGFPDLAGQQCCRRSGWLFRRGCQPQRNLQWDRVRFRWHDHRIPGAGRCHRTSGALQTRYFTQMAKQPRPPQLEP